MLENKESRGWLLNGLAAVKQSQKNTVAQFQYKAVARVD
jgi:hypothetical protein